MRRKATMTSTNRRNIETDARTNHPVEPLPFDVESHEDYLRLRETFAQMPKIPMLINATDAPVATRPNPRSPPLSTS
jgi:hypothetical protein